jgi:hypothetical protein
MITKEKVELTPLTPEVAQRFASMTAVPGERPKRSSRLKYFETLLRTGQFTSPNWAQALVEIGGGEQIYRVDGQHTSEVLATCDPVMFPQGAVVTVTTYRASEADLPALFDMFDNPISARSNTDKMSVYVPKFDELDGIDRGFLAKAAAGIDYYFREAARDAARDAARENPSGAIPWEARMYPKREHGLYFEDERSRTFAVWLHQWDKAKHSWLIGKPGIVAEIFSDWRHVPAVAEHFWAQVFAESNPDPNDDTRELISTLKDWSHKVPKIKQEKFRQRAKRIWDRYRKAVTVEAPATAA